MRKPKVPTIRFWLHAGSSFVTECPKLGLKVKEAFGHMYVDVKGNPFDPTARELTFIPEDAVVCVTFRGVMRLPWWLPNGMFRYEPYYGYHTVDARLYIKSESRGRLSARYVAVWARKGAMNPYMSPLQSLRDAYAAYRRLVRYPEIVRASRSWTASTEDFFGTLPVSKNPVARDGTPIHDVVSVPRE
ncbi:hypothetical protein A3A39_01400 [Candidatus Kaiserbacteria bacterium RIFCSPLOWO2_01_FULL_54_13]|uniref:Uncharacterized protein n=1 Tax=Candidatus Kaiserbacteria bacterium RIFCSPLOWO2_01_FULL_54_13 TaxID=1798512 RepID=A0A1F6F400_9BACT|nr:MAG: hypothetical protein A3A39_01400 [Candidatus Kaiserbacteria bacterium RIFCSPLOWO2_01_FULL_54_13]